MGTLESYPWGSEVGNLGNLGNLESLGNLRNSLKPTQSEEFPKTNTWGWDLGNLGNSRNEGLVLGGGV